MEYLLAHSLFFHDHLGNRQVNVAGGIQLLLIMFAVVACIIYIAKQKNKKRP